MQASDEVVCVVIDIGQSGVRAGFAGEDTPRVVVSTRVGVYTVNGETRFLVGEEQFMAHKEAELQEAMENGFVRDINLLEHIVRFALNKLSVDPKETPLIIVDNSFSSLQVRAQLLEMLFIRLEAPAVYIAKSHVMAAFASGRGTALILDCGASGTSVVPVFDGYALEMATASHSFGGNALTAEAKTMLESELQIDLCPQFLVAKRQIVAPLQPPQFERRQIPHSDSIREYSIEKVCADFKEAVAEVSEAQYNDTDLALRLPKPYEFPSGYNAPFNLERFRLGEMLFNPQTHLSQQSPMRAIEGLCGLHEMVQSALMRCDVDIRAQLLGNIVVCGGGSLIPFLPERLYVELGRTLPSNKIKVCAAPTIERKFASWIGGSILGSLQSFHSLWISRQDYDQNGPEAAAKKFAQ